MAAVLAPCVRPKLTSSLGKKLLNLGNFCDQRIQTIFEHGVVRVHHFCLSIDLRVDFLLFLFVLSLHGIDDDTDE